MLPQVYKPYLLMNKKRYAGLLWTNSEKYDKMDTKVHTSAQLKSMHKINIHTVKALHEPSPWSIQSCQAIYTGSQGPMCERGRQTWWARQVLIGAGVDTRMCLHDGVTGRREDTSRDTCLEVKRITACTKPAMHGDERAERAACARAGHRDGAAGQLPVGAHGGVDVPGPHPDRGGH